MKILFTTIIILFWGNSYIYSQRSLSNPIEPGVFRSDFLVGIYVGEFIPLNPNIITNPPLLYSKTVEKSLSNGLNGLGYGTSISLGASLMINIKPNFYLSFEGNYSKWKSNNMLWSDNQKIIFSENSMMLIQLNIGLKYYFNDNFYVLPELAFNTITINVKENDSRGTIDFSKTYFRLGGGFGIGINFPIYKKLELDVCGKSQFLNLLLNEQDNLTTPESESLISSFGNTKEEIINMIALRIGLIYSL